jgi:hypothetical protein
MTLATARFVVLAALGLALASCNQNPQPSQKQSADTQPQANTVASNTQAPAPAVPAQPAPIPPSTELPLNSVDSVMLSRPADAPAAVVVRVSGTAPTTGWTEPKLTPVPDAGSDTSTMSYQFVATSPKGPEERRVSSPMQAELRIDALSPEVKTIRIVSATNEVSAPVAQ